MAESILIEAHRIILFAQPVDPRRSYWRVQVTVTQCATFYVEAGDRDTARSIAIDAADDIDDYDSDHTSIDVDLARSAAPAGARLVLTLESGIDWDVVPDA